MNDISTAAAPVQLTQFFDALEKTGHVPYASEQTIQRNAAVLRAMYLDLAEVTERIGKSGFTPSLVTLYADVVNIPAGFTTQLSDSALVIVARRVDVGADAKVMLDKGRHGTASLMLFANEVATPLSIVAKTDGADAAFVVAEPPPEGGVQIAYRDGTPKQLARTRAQGLAPTPTDAFLAALRTEFIFASLLYDERPELALAMLTWIKDWGAASSDLLDVLLRSAPLVALLSAQINAQKNGAAFVPYLSKDVYTSLASAFVGQAKDYEANYLALSTQKAVDDNFIKLAESLRDNKALESDTMKKLRDQARANYDNAAAAVEAAQANFEKAQDKVRKLQIDFEDKGIPRWRDKKILEAVVTLATAIVTFAVGIGAMMVGDPAGGAAAGAGAAKGAEAAAEAAEAGAEIAKTAKQTADSMKELKKIVEALKKIYDLSQAVIAVSRNIAGAQAAAGKMASLDVATGGVDLSATSEWEIFRLNADAAMAGPVDQGVEYASALKLAIDALAIYGQALAGAQVAAIKAGQDYAATQLRLALAEAQQARLQRLVDTLKKDKEPTAALMQEFYFRYLDIKSSMFSALENYRAAYFYWALQPSIVKPKIIDDVQTVNVGLDQLTAMSLDTANAQASFHPAPQELRRHQVVITDPAIIERLRSTRATSWVLLLDDPDFPDAERVRMSRVRVWLEHTQASKPGYVALSITNTGVYKDMFDNDVSHQPVRFQFVAAPLLRDFRYRISATDESNADRRFEDGTFGYVEVDGEIDRRLTFAYFEPTPYSEWQITVRTSAQDLDLSDVTSIIMEFSGSCILKVRTAMAVSSARTRRRTPLRALV